MRGPLHLDGVLGVARLLGAVPLGRRSRPSSAGGSSTGLGPTGVGSPPPPAPRSAARRRGAAPAGRRRASRRRRCRRSGRRAAAGSAPAAGSRTSSIASSPSGSSSWLGTGLSRRACGGGGAGVLGRAQLAGEQLGVVVLGHDVAAGLVVGELRGARPAAHGVRRHQGPAPVGPAPGVPLDVLVVQGVLGKNSSAASPRVRAAVVVSPVRRRNDPLSALWATCWRSAMTGSGEGHDRVDGRLGRGGDVLGGLARADARLDVSGAQCAVHLRLQLTESSVLATQCRRAVGCPRERRTPRPWADQDQPRAVLRSAPPG